MRTKLIVIGVLAAIAAFALPTLGAAAGKTELEAKLKGSNQVGDGDPDGSGKAKVTISKKEACFDITYKKIAAPMAGHIHQAPKGEDGAIVIPFFDNPDGESSPIEGCVKADKGLLKDIKNDPSGFYVNLHNEDYPAGAIRGQLKVAKGS